MDTVAVIYLNSEAEYVGSAEDLGLSTKGGAE